MHEIEIYNPRVGVVQGSIAFQDYEKLMKEAREVANFVQGIQVTGENIKDVKKVLANVNKSLKMLNDTRVTIKKEILRPYETFAEQVKEIENIVRSADTVVRDKVRDMEELERQEKKAVLREIWNKRVRLYSYAKIMAFGDWLIPQHLNKSITLQRCEEDMTEWLERVERELAILYTMEKKEELIHAYRESLDMAIAIESVRIQEEEKQRQKEILEEVVEEKEEVYLVSIKGKKNLNYVKMLLKEHEIEFEIVKGE